MQRDELARIARTWFDEVLTNRNPAAIDVTYAESYVFHGNGAPPTSKAGAKALAEMLLGASSDRRAFVDAQVVEGDTVVTRWHSEGTHTGTMFGVPPTGRHMVVSGITITRVKDGLIVEEWESNNAPLVVASLREPE